MPKYPGPALRWLVVAGTLLARLACAAADPAAAQVDRFHGALLECMKAGATLSIEERYSKLAPVIGRTFDLPVMTGFAVGPAWAGFSPAQQQASIAAFTRLTVASYAHNFRDFSGEQFDTDADVAVRGRDRIVQTHLLRPHDAPVNLIYRMRESEGSWKVIDVYYGAISQLTTRRSDFAAPIAAGGAPGLIAHLNELSADLMK